jgi:hypothetical protein
MLIREAKRDDSAPLLEKATDGTLGYSSADALILRFKRRTYLDWRTSWVGLTSVFRYGLNRLPKHFSRADFDIKEGKKREQALETASLVREILHIHELLAYAYHDRNVRQPIMGDCRDKSWGLSLHTECKQKSRGRVQPAVRRWESAYQDHCIHDMG